MTTIVVAASIPSAFTGFCFWLIEQNLKKRADNEKEEREERQKQLDEREQIREKNELCIINSVNAAMSSTYLTLCAAPVFSATLWSMS